MKDNVKQVGIMVGVGLNYIQNNNWLYSIIDVINIVSGTVDRIFNDQRMDFTGKHFLTYFNGKAFTYLRTTDNLSSEKKSYLIDDAKHLEGYDFDMVM